jgi:glutamate dehydrogenase
MKRLLEIEGESASGEEVIRRILSAKVDLLYNGGIGTYVKAAGEDDAAVGDRANDRVRVNGADVRARVMAEGGNLGLTQRGRLEHWMRGGLANTDAIDNSGGVSTSDHEVNIKILADLLIKRELLKKEQRNALLAEMTDEVAALVLLDNQRQALALSLDSLRSAQRYEEFLSLIDELLGAGVLSRRGEAIPSREELLQSPERPRGLPRPLLAVLLGHSKMFAFQMLMETEFPESAGGRPFLLAYFPKRLRDAFADQFDGHALRREIVATAAVNAIVNQAGVTFLPRLMSSTKAGIGEVVAAYFDVERDASAQRVREAALAAPRDALAQQRALLDVEERIEGLVRERLAGKTAELVGALAEIEQRLRS